MDTLFENNALKLLTMLAGRFSGAHGCAYSVGTAWACQCMVINSFLPFSLRIAMTRAAQYLSRPLASR